PWHLERVRRSVGNLFEHPSNAFEASKCPKKTTRSPSISVRHIVSRSWIERANGRVRFRGNYHEDGSCLLRRVRDVRGPQGPCIGGGRRRGGRRARDVRGRRMASRTDDAGGCPQCPERSHAA